MDQLIKYGRDRLIIGLVSLLSASFVSRGPLETNPQDCEMTIMVKRKKKTITQHKNTQD